MSVMRSMRAETAICAEGAAHPVLPDPQGAEPTGVAEGAPVAVPGGSRPVEALRRGDLVLTRDLGPQPIRRLIRQDEQGAEVIRVSAGALGNPEECLLAPGTRVLMTGWAVELYLGLDECLVPIGALCGTPGIARTQVTDGVFTTIELAKPGLIHAGGLDIECAPGPGPCAVDGPAFGEVDLPPVVDGPEVRLLRPE